MAIGNASASGTALYIRMWVPGETGASVPPCQTVTCLVTDLIAASGGVVQEAHGQICCAHFFDLQSGAMAARRLQWAVQGLAETANLAEMAVAVLVQHAEDSPAAMTQDSLPRVLEQAAPGQILLTEKAGKLLDEMAGFSLGSPSKCGLRELLWRAPNGHATRARDEKIIAGFVEQKGPEIYAEVYAQPQAAQAAADSFTGKD